MNDTRTTHDPDQRASAEPADVADGSAPIEDLSESDCWALLRSVSVGRIGTAGEGGGIEIFPINFLVDHGTIVFRTAAGTKLTHVSQTEEIAFEADDVDPAADVAWSVVVKGTPKVLRGRDDLFDAFAIHLVPWHGSEKPFFVRLVPTSMSGRRFVRSS